MPTLDPLLVCICAAVLVLIAHGIFAVAKHRSTDGEPHAIAEGATAILCGLAFLAPLSMIPLVSHQAEIMFLVGTMCAVVASGLPIIVVRHRDRRHRDGAAHPRGAFRRRPGVRVVRATRGHGAAPATRPLPVVRPPANASELALRGAPSATVSSAVAPEASPAQPIAAQLEAQAQAEAEAAAAVTAKSSSYVDRASKTLDEVDGVVTDVTSWLRLDR